MTPPNTLITCAVVLGVGLATAKLVSASEAEENKREIESYIKKYDAYPQQQEKVR